MPRTFFLALTEVWFWQLVSGVLFILCLGLIVYRPWRYSGRKYLKRLSKLRKSQNSFINSGMNWDKSLSDSQLEEARKLALLDLAELLVPLRENLNSLRHDAIRNVKEYNKKFVKVIRQKKKFSSAVYAVGLAGIDVPSDPLNSIYDEAIEKLKPKPVKKIKKTEAKAVKPEKEKPVEEKP